MLFSNTQKSNLVGKHFMLDEADKKKIASSINKIIGQLETIKKDVLTDNACDESLTQILAVKGGVSSLGLNLVSKGVLDCLTGYSKSELELIMKNMFKLS